MGEVRGMRKTLGTIVSAVVILGGIILRGPWHALDVIGRILTMLDAPEVFNRLIDWIATHPGLAEDIGPWVLICGGVLSLAAIHAQGLRVVVTKVRQLHAGRFAGGPQSKRSPAINPTLEAVPSDNIHDLPVVDLRLRVIRFGLAVTNLQSAGGLNLTKSDLELARLRRSLSFTFDDEKSAALSKRIDDLAQLMEARRSAHCASVLSQFNTKLRSEAITLRDELSRRTGIAIRDVNDPTTGLLERGELSQISELRTVANFLGEMAKHLDVD